MLKARARLAPAATAMLAALAAIGCSGADSSSRAAATGGLQRLTVSKAPTPTFDVPHYVTRGTYPRVSGTGIDLEPVNAALTAAVTTEQRRFARIARAQQRRVSPGPDPGLFATRPPPGLTSASSVVVSTLLSLTERFPSGTGGLRWLGTTVRVPSGKAVSIGDLLAGGPRGLRALAAAARAQVLAEHPCVRDSIGQVPRLDRGFAPTASNYRQFALLASGLAIGFRVEQVGLPPCGRVRTTIPYAKLRGHLSPLGKRLVAGVRPPRGQ